MPAILNHSVFRAHLIVYVAVNAILLAINAWQIPVEGEIKSWWAVWVIAGWGIGVAAHILAEWMQGRSNEGLLLGDPDVRGVAVHLFVYLGVNALLIFLNLNSSPENIWFVWPLLGWGLALAAHAWLAYNAVTRRTVARYAAEQQVLSEMQLERQAADIAAAIAQPEKKKVRPARKRRKQTAKKTTRKAAARRGTAAKRAPKRKPKKPARKKT